MAELGRYDGDYSVCKAKNISDLALCGKDFLTSALSYKLLRAGTRSCSPLVNTLRRMTDT